MPRGVQSGLIHLLNEIEVQYKIENYTKEGKGIDIEFKGQLRDLQEKAFEALVAEKNGVLSATTGFGKTVIGAKIISEKKVNTLILVHTQQLATQWIDRLEEFLIINEKIEEAPISKKGRKKNNQIIGQLGGGKKRVNGIIDVAIMQSLFDREKNVKELVNDYGMIIVDECHHVSASSFNRILSKAKARNVYGLSATPIRKDGQHPIIFMQCGPIRYKVDAKKEAEKREFDHFIIPRFTSFRKPLYQNEKEWHISDIYKHLCENKLRNKLIVDDIEKSVNDGRHPIVLTERISHMDILHEIMQDRKIKTLVLSGKMALKERRRVIQALHEAKHNERIVLLATGKLIGEGFDEAKLDTLFLTMPISWKGTIAQYAGRLHRQCEGKDEVFIYDYVDVHVSVLERMYQRRLNAYRAVGYSMKSDIKSDGKGECIYTSNDYFKGLLDDIENSTKSVVISSPYLQKKKVKLVEDLLVSKYHNGIRIVLILKDLVDYPDKSREWIEEFTARIDDAGIDVMHIKGYKQKFVIIDNDLIWYGGVDVLGMNRHEESMIRIRNAELGNELISSIESRGISDDNE